MKNRRDATIEYAPDVVISSAQNQEDVLLFRAFRGRSNGFYVDVGAGDPNWDSVTNWFYRVGWTGINVEANPMFQQSYAHYRSKDINLGIGISTTGDSLRFFKVEQDHQGHGWGLSSFVPSAQATAEALGFSVATIEVQTRTLASVLAEHASDRTIDFLKVDVEGFEGEVLRSNDWSRHRPLVVCVEAVSPNSARPSHADWESILLASDYVFAVFDGVNNYYVRSDEFEILTQLNASVNCNDRYRKIRPDDVA